MSITITKKIAKHGENIVLIIPKDLHPFLKHGDLVKVNIDMLRNSDAPSGTSACAKHGISGTQEPHAPGLVLDEMEEEA